MIELDGQSLSVENLMKIGEGQLKVKVCLLKLFSMYINTTNWAILQMSKSALSRVKESRKVVDDIVASNKGCCDSN